MFITVVSTTWKLLQMCCIYCWKIKKYNASHMTHLQNKLCYKRERPDRIGYSTIQCFTHDTFSIYAINYAIKGEKTRHSWLLHNSMFHAWHIFIYVINYAIKREGPDTVDYFTIQCFTHGTFSIYAISYNIKREISDRVDYSTIHTNLPQWNVPDLLTLPLW